MRPSDFFFAVDYTDDGVVVILTSIVYFKKTASVQPKWDAEQLKVPTMLGLKMVAPGVFAGTDGEDTDVDLLMYRMTEAGFQQNDHFTSVALGV